MILRTVTAYRNFLIVVAFLSIAIITFVWYPNLIAFKSASWAQHCLPAEQDITHIPPVYSEPAKRKNVIVASEFGYHTDVYMTMTWTLERVMGRGIPLYVNEHPFYFGFDEIIQNLGIHTGPLYTNYKQLRLDLESDPTIDVVVFGTCEIDMRDVGRNRLLLQAWDARDDSHKFRVICIVHHVSDIGWHPNLAEWSRRNAVRLVTLSEHIRSNYLTYFDEVAENRTLHLESFERVPVDVLVPIFDIPNLREPSADRVLSNAVIQGSFSSNRRNYQDFFAELVDSLADDSSVWGYLPLGEGNFYEVDTSLPSSPFKLHLLGSGDIEIPEVLKNIVMVRRNMNYTDYYATMNAMDICIPAFATHEYYTGLASSTVFMALESNLPILGTRRLRKAYTYVDDDRVTVTRPAGMSELAAIRALRTGDASDFFRRIDFKKGRGVPQRLRESVDEMVRRGWRRTNADFTEVKRRVWAENERLVERLLRDL